MKIISCPFDYKNPKQKLNVQKIQVIKGDLERTDNEKLRISSNSKFLLYNSKAEWAIIKIESKKLTYREETSPKDKIIALDFIQVSMQNGKKAYSDFILICSADGRMSLRQLESLQVKQKIQLKFNAILNSVRFSKKQ